VEESWPIVDANADKNKEEAITSITNRKALAAFFILSLLPRHHILEAVLI
jgi:hypothetical protein